MIDLKVEKMRAGIAGLEPALTTVAFGHVVDLLKPDPNKIHIQVIARALSKQCRFNGHTSQFYPVAAHCVHVSLLAERKYALEALLHDAAEAYLGDIVSPLKALLPDYRYFESLWDAAIAETFSLDTSEEAHKEVKRADTVALRSEVRAFMEPPLGSGDKHWKAWWEVWEGPLEGEFADISLAGQMPDLAEAVFMDRYYHLVEQRQSSDAG